MRPSAPATAILIRADRGPLPARFQTPLVDGKAEAVNLVVVRDACGAGVVGL
jgi:hypothetical protein